MKSSTILHVAGGMAIVALLALLSVPPKPALADPPLGTGAAPPQQLWCCDLNHGGCYSGTGGTCRAGGAPYPDEPSCNLGCGAGGPGVGPGIGARGSSFL